MTATSASRGPRYEPHESLSLPRSLGLGVQPCFIYAAGVLITPVIVIKASGGDDSYLAWMIFATLATIGMTTLLQVGRIGRMGTGLVLPMRTSFISIPFCIMALVDGGPATLTTLVLVTAAFQILIARWLFILRRIVTPLVGGTVLMIVTLSLASVVFNLLNTETESGRGDTFMVALVTGIVIVILTLRGSAALRLWAPIICIIIGCAVAVYLDIYDFERVTQADWVGFPASGWPGPGLAFGTPFWTLLPAFLFIGAIIAIQVNGDVIAVQQVSWRQTRAIDFRKVQGAIRSTGVGNLVCGIAGTVPNVTTGGIVSFIQITGAASRNVGYCIGGIFLALAFLPKVSGLFSNIPGPVIAGYFVVVIGFMFVEGARTVIRYGTDRSKILIAGVSFWVGAAFEYRLFVPPDFGPLWGTMFQSGVTTGGLTAIILTLFMEITSPRRMRFRSPLGTEALPELTAFITKFSDRKDWGPDMAHRLVMVAEEVLLSLAPAEEGKSHGDRQRLVVMASSDGPQAELEFIVATSEENLEDRIQQHRQYDPASSGEHEISLRLLQHYASSVRHQQYHEMEIVTIRVDPI
ncbi:MAG: hypothetical protein OXN16_09835 [Gammaproteobacteria bacterium]|nr:hypothetical protein [Gammaproteobacteria bacterium]